MLSYPNRKPPSVETVAATMRGAREGSGADEEFSLPASAGCSAEPARSLWPLDYGFGRQQKT